MDDTKTWHESKTIWGALIAILSIVLNAAGAPLAASDQAQLVDALVAISGAAGGLLAIYGRFTAEHRLS